MNKNRIYILSQPIQTGNTTLLLNWVSNQPDIGGILTPDVDGKRMLYDISTQTRYTLQLPDDAEGIRIGRFVFDVHAFDTAQRILRACMQKNYTWTVADEVGRLEMDESKGLEPAIHEVIDYFKQPGETKLLLVIRDYLLQQAISHYGLQEAEILPRSFFGDTTDETKKPMGLVLCGGKSTRMGRDKAFIQYHHKPQYAYMADMLNRFCKSVFISCADHQFPLLMPGYKGLIDSATFADAGPLTGLLTAQEAVPEESWLVVGCDYPYLITADLDKLVSARSEMYDAVCYRHPHSQMDEPLIALYEKTGINKLVHAFAEGRHSLRHELANMTVLRLLPDDSNRLQSVDYSS
ncbi:MAG: NTP transferase domain-containing protein [Bacteroidota bacterium]